jgi:hypothetical protein
LERERNELDGCRDAIDKATGLLLDRGRVGASLGLDSAVHAISTAMQNADRRVKKWEVALDSFVGNRVEVEAPSKSVPPASLHAYLGRSCSVVLDLFELCLPFARFDLTAKQFDLFAPFAALGIVTSSAIAAFKSGEDQATQRNECPDDCDRQRHHTILRSAAASFSPMPTAGIPQPPSHLVEMSRRGFSAFSPEEEARLRVYREAISELDRRDIANRTELKWRMEVGFEDVSEEQLIALAACVRKLGFIQNEPVSFDRIHKLLLKNAKRSNTSDGGTIAEWLREVTDLRDGFLASSRVGSEMLVKYPDGSSESLSPRTILDLFLNGAVFHSDECKRAKWDELRGWESKGSMAIVTMTLWDLLSVFRALDSLIATIPMSSQLPPTFKREGHAR